MIFIHHRPLTPSGDPPAYLPLQPIQQFLPEAGQGGLDGDSVSVQRCGQLDVPGQRQLFYPGPVFLIQPNGQAASGSNEDA